MATKMATRMITVLDPTGRPTAAQVALAPRVHGLANRRIGFLWNTKPNGEVILKRVGERLSQQSKLASTDWQQKATSGLPAAPEIYASLVKSSDLVFLALGD